MRAHAGKGRDDSFYTYIYIEREIYIYIHMCISTHWHYRQMEQQAIPPPSPTDVRVKWCIKLVEGIEQSYDHLETESMQDQCARRRGLDIAARKGSLLGVNGAARLRDTKAHDVAETRAP